VLISGTYSASWGKGYALILEVINNIEVAEEENIEAALLVM